MKNYNNFLNFYERVGNILKEISDPVGSNEMYEINIQKVQEFEDLLMEAKRQQKQHPCIEAAKRNLRFLKRVKRLYQKGVKRYKLKSSPHSYYSYHISGTLENIANNLPVTTLKKCRQIQSEKYCIEKDRLGEKNQVFAVDSFYKWIYWFVEEFEEDSETASLKEVFFTIKLRNHLEFWCTLLIFVLVYYCTGYVILAMIGLYVSNTLLRVILYGIALVVLLAIGLIVGGLIYIKQVEK